MLKLIDNVYSLFLVEVWLENRLRLLLRANHQLMSMLWHLKAL